MPTTMMKLLNYDPKTGRQLYPSNGSALERAATLRSISSEELLDLVSAAALVLDERGINKVEARGVTVRITVP